MLAMFFWAFVVGGIICVIGQLLFDVAKLTPGHTMSLLVVIGAILDGLGLYEPLVDFAGAGATIPITKFSCSWSTSGCKSPWNYRRVNRDVSGNKLGNFCSDYFWVYRRTYL